MKCPVEGNFSLNHSFKLLFTFPWMRTRQFWGTRSYRNLAAQKHRERGDIPIIAHLLGIQKGLHLIPLKSGRWGVGNQTTSRANERKDFESFCQVCGGKAHCLKFQLKKQRRHPHVLTKAGEHLKEESALGRKWQQAGRKGAAGGAAVQRGRLAPLS